MVVSTRGRYALRVLIDMAEHSESDRIYRRNLAEKDTKWVTDPVDTILDTIVSFLEEELN